jgi:predicted nucleic acid-binding protein
LGVEEGDLLEVKLTEAGMTIKPKTAVDRELARGAVLSKMIRVDNIYLACAMEGKADLIVSGERHLKDLKSFRQILIVDPAIFLRHLRVFHGSE